MASHISTKQVIDHIKSATSASIDGVVYKTITVDAVNLNIGPVKFPLDHFDIGGMNPSTVNLVDSDNNMRMILLLGEDDLKLDHPIWDIEPYEPARLRHSHLFPKK